MTNPLSNYFRQPAIYIRLPSGGKFYPEHTVVVPPNGELPVLPMTAIDEITYRTPDALFNGTAVVNVIQSCVPGIKDAWVVPACDLDTILVAIRIATYGHEMEVNCTCPKCKHEDQYTTDLRSSLDLLKPGEYEKPFVHSDMEIYFRPMTYKVLNQNSQLQYEEQRALQSIAQASEAATEAQSQTISLVLAKITDMTVKALAQSIAAIRTPTSIVTDLQQIEEFLKNTDRRLFNQIRDRIIALKSAGELKPLKVECTSCSHQYEQGFTMDMSSFFESAS